MADIPQHLVDEILAKCCRHCCVCRRFEPLHLQVHHIVRRSEGGSNDLDNLIAVCLTCHCDVHTRTLFTRRFTPGELKLHRAAVFALVADGKLPLAPAPQESPVAVIASAAIDRLTEPVIQPRTPALTLSQTAVEILIAAAKSRDGTILLLRSFGGSALQVDGKDLLEDGQPRTFARYENGLEELLSEGLVQTRGHKGYLFQITHPGYVLADELMAAGTTAIN